MAKLTIIKGPAQHRWFVQLRDGDTLLVQTAVDADALLQLLAQLGVALDCDLETAKKAIEEAYLYANGRH